MATLFDQADLVISATNPDVAFPADGPFPTEVGGGEVELSNQRASTIPANFYGNPSISIPIGLVDGLPVGMQVMAAHFREDVLLDLALLAERSGRGPWSRPARRDDRVLVVEGVERSRVDVVHEPAEGQLRWDQRAGPNPIEVVGEHLTLIVDREEIPCDASAPARSVTTAANSVSEYLVIA